MTMKSAFIAVFICIVLFSGINAASIESYQKADENCAKQVKDPACRKKCVFEKMGLADKAGKANMRRFPTQFREVMSTCSKSLQDENSCNKINKLQDCVRSQGKTYIINNIKQCAAETNTRVNIITILTTYPGALKDESKACFHRCVGIKLKVIDKKGALTLDDFDAVMRDNKVDFKAIRNECTKKFNQNDVCVKSISRMICVGAAARKYKSRIQELMNIL